MLHGIASAMKSSLLELYSKKIDERYVFAKMFIS